MEIALFALVVLVALASVYRAARPHMRFRVLVVLAAALAVAGACLWQGRTKETVESARRLREKVPATTEHSGYVPADTCAACHPREHDSWHTSFHRTMTQLATPEAVQADFGDVQLELEGTTFSMERRGDEFWVATRPTAPGPDGVQSRGAERRIGMLTGSHHMQVFWAPDGPGNRQKALPFSWLIPEARWVPNRDTFLRDPQLPFTDSTWNSKCIDCHSVAGQPRRDKVSSEFDTRVAELGIACGACHGPGEQHLEANRNPGRRYGNHRKEEDASIVNPDKLDARASSQVCGHCHSIKFVPDRDDWRVNGFAYRPGDDLHAVTPVIQPSTFLDGADPHGHPRPPQKYLDNRFWPDGMVRVSGREYNGMIDSKCYDGGKLSCVSCHSMHEYSDADDQLASGMESNAACVQCHEKIGKRLEQHTHHAPASTGSLCYNCHMPHTTYGLLKAIRSHTIDSPDVGTQQATGRPNACNICHLDRSLGWTAKYLDEWYEIPRPTLPQEHHQISAAVLDLFRGDAGQRALAAWHMGWEPARKASREDWLAPWLALRLNDPYSAVRLVAYRSLRLLPGYEGFEYDYVGPTDERARATRTAISLWEAAPAGGTADGRLLIDENGVLDLETARFWVNRRNRRSMDLQE